MAEVRHSTAEHHRDSRERLETLGVRVEKIETDMKPLSKTVATMETIVAGYAATRWKIAGAFVLGTTIVTVLGWVVSLFAGKIIAWMLGSSSRSEPRATSPAGPRSDRCRACDHDSRWR